ncbi:MAG: hypothetical protein AABW88_03650 [Nanoarchaeota archaeon]
MSNKFSLALEYLASDKSETEKNCKLRDIFGHDFNDYGFFLAETVARLPYLTPDQSFNARKFIYDNDIGDAWLIHFSPFYAHYVDTVTSIRALRKMDEVSGRYHLERTAKLIISDEDEFGKDIFSTEEHELGESEDLEILFDDGIDSAEICLNSSDFSLFLKEFDLEFRVKKNSSPEELSRANFVFDAFYSRGIATKDVKELKKVFDKARMY